MSCARVDVESGGVVVMLGGTRSGELAQPGDRRTCLACSIDNNLTRKLSNADPVQLAMIKGLGAGTLNATLRITVGAQWPQLSAALAAGIVGFLGYGVSLICFILALRHLGTARTGAYFSMASFVGATVAVTTLGEPLTPRFVVAATLMAAGLYLHVTERHEHEHVHEPMAHERTPARARYASSARLRC